MIRAGVFVVVSQGQYTGSDAIQVADLPYSPDKCNELGFVDYSKQGKKP